MKKLEVLLIILTVHKNAKRNVVNIRPPSSHAWSISHKYVLDKMLAAAGLAQSVERLTAAREVAGSIPGIGPILRVLK